MIVQVKVELNGSFLNVMTCTYNCSYLQGFLAVFPVCVFFLAVSEYHVSSRLPAIVYLNCSPCVMMCLHVLCDSTKCLPPTWQGLDLRSAYYSLIVHPPVCITVDQS